MKNKTIYSALLSLVVFILAIILENPFDILMLDMVLEGALLVLVVVIGLFAGMVWKERFADEREREIRSDAGRIAYLGGLLVLTVGIVYEHLKGNDSMWLVGSLAAMVVIKLLSYEYFERKK